ncbi:MAG: phage major capsid protein [Planctomycetes bacterium]|nr:phage major capsid protein [Planctomycetota bacterium]
MFVQLCKEFLGKPVGERIDVADADAAELIRQGWAQPIDHDVLTPAITRAVQGSLDDVVDLAMQNWLRRQPGRSRDSAHLPFAGLGNSALDDPRAGFRHFGEFALAVRDACQPGKRPDDRLALITKTASGMGEVTGSDGGFLVPAEFVQKILERLYAKGNLLAMTDSYTVGSNVIAFPRSAETSRANGSRWGGVRAYWRDEGEQGTATKATFGRLQLNLRKLFVMINASDELLSDTQGIALEQYLFRVASEEISFVVSDAIINGNGTGQPLGILNSDCLVTVAKESGQTAATVNSTNVMKMWSRMWAACRQNAVWLIHQDVEPQLQAMTISSGASNLVAYLPPGGLSANPYATLMGRPVVPVEWCATLGTVGDIILADLRHYVTATRGGVEPAMSIHLRFDYDESVFRFIFRIDGAPWWSSALTPYKGSNTQSCFVALATRA